MRIQIPKILHPINLSEYAVEFGDAQIQVWVNPPIRLLAELDALMEAVGAGEFSRLFQWLSEIWSQGPEESHWTVEEIRQLFEESQESDPALFIWLYQRTLESITEHREVRKKV